MSILAKPEIVSACARATNRLVITPLLSPEKQLGIASIDVRLGNEFILLRRRAIDALNISRREDFRARIGAYQEKVRIEFGQPFTLHPGQLVLGATLEYVKMPTDIGCHVLGRSSWGRLGLVIETASAVEPDFSGCITLELVNIGEVPLVLYPGVRIAQLLLHTVTSKVQYSGRYRSPTGPQFSRVYDDDDIGFWCRHSSDGDTPQSS